MSVSQHIDLGPAVSEQFGGPTDLFAASRKLSKLFRFCADDDVLFVAPGRQLKKRESELALAYGLAYAGDRDLWLALPPRLAKTTRRRVAFFETKIRVFVGDGSAPREVVPFAQAEILAGPQERIVTGHAVLGERAHWVAPLIEWASAAPGLDAAHRRSYLAWHCEGRSVLRIEPRKRDIIVGAGVNYSKPSVGQVPPVKTVLSKEVTPEQVHRSVAAAADAAADRLAGVDDRHAEHRLQALLQPHHFGWRTLQREFPARRSDGGRGFIDFLGVDKEGHLHVVETKIGPDEMLVLQGLDYWVWANQHLPQLREYLSLADHPRVFLDFVVAANKSSVALGPYSAAQAEALDGAIPWRFHVLTGLADGPMGIKSLPRRSVPKGTARAVEEPRFAIRLQRHLTERAEASGQKLKAGVFLASPADGLLPPAVEALATLEERGLAHGMVGHVRSSQAFALNLFAGLDTPGRIGILSLLGLHDLADADAVEFEWSSADDELGEATPASKHRTQVDVVLRGRAVGGGRVVALIEVKLSETDFGWCSAWTAPKNPYRKLCSQDAPFGGDPEHCFQLSNKGGPHRRRYDEFLGELPGPFVEAGCPFRTANQPMRNVALARVLRATGAADSVVVACCAHDDHKAIWRRWNTAKAALQSVQGVTLSDLPASEVLKYHTPSAADQLRARYLIS